jgi:two-component system response regulator HydG/two-component system response regulator AtoC
MHERALRGTTRRLPDPLHGTSAEQSTDTIVGCSAALERIRAWIARVAPTRLPVLITGETGTGKELVAAAIHRASRRASDRFMCLNCAALPDTLIESELFGYERGAFTGAYESRTGLLRSCDGGTLFLDEVGDLSLQAQAKLLRVIEMKQVPRLGDSRTWSVDFRVVAATNRDLGEMTREGLFRRDLFYRLNVARIQIPPLRERPDDVEPLIAHCVALLNREFSGGIEGVSPEAARLLKTYSWPGNVRELRNILESAFVTCDGPLIDVHDLPPHLRPPDGEPRSRGDERERLLEALSAVNWNKSKAACLLKWSRMTLYRKLAKYALSHSAANGQKSSDL